MNIAIFVGGNKDHVPARLAVKLAETLQHKGFCTTLLSIKGKIKIPTSVPVQEYLALVKPKSLSQTLQKRGTDFVLSFMNLTACRAAAEGGIPFVYLEQEGFKEDTAQKDKKTLLKQAKQVLVIKNTDKPLSKTVYAGLKVQAVQNPAVWGERYDYQKPACFCRENNIVSSARLDKNSGFDRLLKTWSRLAPAHQSWHLTLCGEGASKAALLKAIAKAGLENRVSVVGEESDLYSLLRQADIFAYPADKAACADVLLDAMACKLPCVACETPQSLAWIQNGVNGLIVNAGEEEPFTIALDQLMVDWGKRVGMAIEASKIKDTYPFDSFVASIVCHLY